MLTDALTCFQFVLQDPHSSSSVQSIPESKFEKKIVSIQEDHRDITSRLQDPGEEVSFQKIFRIWDYYALPSHVSFLHVLVK